MAHWSAEEEERRQKLMPKKKERYCIHCQQWGGECHCYPDDPEGKGSLQERFAKMIDKNGDLKETVNHPSHYNRGKIEVIDYIVDQDLDFREGNIVKYVSRHKWKNGLEDLKKAQFYLNHLVNEMEAKNGKEKDPGNASERNSDLEDESS